MIAHQLQGTSNIILIPLRLASVFENKTEKAFHLQGHKNCISDKYEQFQQVEINQEKSMKNTHFNENTS